MFSLRGGRWRGGSAALGNAPNGVAVERGEGPLGLLGAREGPGAIHRVLQPTLPELDIHEEYDVIRSLGEGCFARVLLAQHRDTGSTVVLKAVRIITLK